VGWEGHGGRKVSLSIEGCRWDVVLVRWDRGGHGGRVLECRARVMGGGHSGSVHVGCQHRFQRQWQ
jgi:hypothetical protein